MIYSHVSAPNGKIRIQDSGQSETQLIKQYLPLVHKIAYHIHSSMPAIELEDMRQIGLAALIEAYRTYQDLGATFATYATTRVRGAIIDELRRSATISRQGMQNRKKIKAVRATLEQGLGRAATTPEMIDAMGVEPKRYFELLSSAEQAHYDSMDDVYSESNSAFTDLFADIEENLAEGEMLDLMQNAIQNLSERERQIIQLYFQEEMNLAEIGAILDIGAARVCQIKANALKKVRTHVESISAHI